MPVFDLFSKRQRLRRGEVPDVYTYDVLPPALRVQMIHIITDAFGKDLYSSTHAQKAYKLVHDILCREYGEFELVKHQRNQTDGVVRFIGEEKSVERVLDAVEVSCRVMERIIAGKSRYEEATERKITPEDAIDELNERFREHGVGYQYESSEILRVDSEFIHAEAVKPALGLLRMDGFAGANDEFLEAHEHYRHGRNKESIGSALKAFESVLKGICKIKKWNVGPNETANPLIAVCFAKALFPAYLESQLGSLRTLLESGVPTVRNRLGGHGQGAEPVSVPDYMARYALNLTAANILLLMEAAFPKK